MVKSLGMIMCSKFSLVWRLQGLLVCAAGLCCSLGRFVLNVGRFLETVLVDLQSQDGEVLSEI